MVRRRLIYLHEFLELANSTKPLFSSASAWCWAETTANRNRNSAKSSSSQGKGEQELQSLSGAHHGNWSCSGGAGLAPGSCCMQGLVTHLHFPSPIEGLICHRVPWGSGAADAISLPRWPRWWGLGWSGGHSQSCWTGKSCG